MTDKMSEIQKIAESIKRGIDEGNEALSNRSILFYELWCAYDRLRSEMDKNTTETVEREAQMGVRMQTLKAEAAVDILSIISKDARIVELEAKLAAHVDLDGCPCTVSINYDRAVNRITELEAEVERQNKIIDNDQGYRDAVTEVEALKLHIDAQITVRKGLDAEVERKDKEMTNMKKYINQRSDGLIPYPEVEPNFVKFKPSDPPKPSEDKPSEWKEPQCQKCGGPMVHVGHNEHGQNHRDCMHWYCEKCKMYNWPGGLELGDECPVCNPKPSEDNDGFHNTWVPSETGKAVKK